MTKPRVHILIPTYQPHDAVGNDVTGMYHMLNQAGYPTKIHAQHVHPDVRQNVSVLEFARDFDGSDASEILIYHHAIAWEMGEEILAKSRNKLVVKYHNVTPPEFFTNYSDYYYWACVNGRDTTARLARIPGVRVWGDSWYNAQEMVDLGAPREQCRVVAPIHKIDDLTREPFDSVVLGAYRGSTPNIMFVGGLRPNKGHAKALEVLRALQETTGVAARLLFVGNFDRNLARYTEDLQQYVRHLDLAGDVIFAPSVTPSQMRAYYMTASVFLCVSEHEGFCVPLVEAMAFRVPIVAWATTAVGETAADAGLVYSDFAPDDLAGGIAQILEDPYTARDLAQRGRRRYENHFGIEAIRAQLLKLIEEVAAQ